MTTRLKREAFLRTMTEHKFDPPLTPVKPLVERINYRAVASEIVALLEERGATVRESLQILEWVKGEMERSPVKLIRG